MCQFDTCDLEFLQILTFPDILAKTSEVFFCCFFFTLTFLADSLYCKLIKMKQNAKYKKNEYIKFKYENIFFLFIKH